MLITTFEHGYLTQADFPNPSDFDWLLEQNFDGFNVERKNKNWRIKVSHYIGLIGLPSGTQLEILPKISQTLTNETQANKKSDIAQTRQWLQQMLLDTWQVLTPKHLPNLATQNPLTIVPTLPLTDWLQTQFWQLFQTYQPNQQYQRFEQNQAYLQGKLLIKQQLQHNAHQPHKFFHQTDEFINDTACNRLIKTTFQTVISRFHSMLLPSQWRNVQTVLPTQYHATFTQAKHELSVSNAPQNAIFINVCYALLTLQQGAGQGQTPSPTLLINMQFAFEKWVTLKIGEQFSNVHIIPQKNQALTADNTLTLKPDIWLQDDTGIKVFDIKWKNIPSVNDISLADMYQLLTYATEFNANEASLIIPTLDKTLIRQEILLANVRNSRFYLVPFYLNKGVLSK